MSTNREVIFLNTLYIVANVLKKIEVFLEKPLKLIVSVLEFQGNAFDAPKTDEAKPLAARTTEFDL